MQALSKLPFAYVSFQVSSSGKTPHFVACLHQSLSSNQLLTSYLQKWSHLLFVRLCTYQRSCRLKTCERLNLLFVPSQLCIYRLQSYHLLLAKFCQYSRQLPARTTKYFLKYGLAPLQGNLVFVLGSKSAGFYAKF